MTNHTGKIRAGWRHLGYAAAGVASVLAAAFIAVIVSLVRDIVADTRKDKARRTDADELASARHRGSRDRRSS